MPSLGACSRPSVAVPVPPFRLVAIVGSSIEVRGMSLPRPARQNERWSIANGSPTDTEPASGS